MDKNKLATLIRESLTELRRDIYTSSAFAAGNTNDEAKAIQEQEAVGIMLAAFAEWDGHMILRIAAAALEDANFASESEQVAEMLRKAEAE